MEFRIAKAEFLRGLRLAQGIADRKSTMPMLANVLLRTQGKNQLLVAATDLNVSLTAELKSHNASDGGIAILAKSLFDLVANAPGDEVTLKKADNHWAEIKSGKVTYRIVGMPDRDFPKVPGPTDAHPRDDHQPPGHSRRAPRRARRRRVRHRPRARLGRHVARGDEVPARGSAVACRRLVALVVQSSSASSAVTTTSSTHSIVLRR
jgi:hypothetical protein